MNHNRLFTRLWLLPLGIVAVTAHVYFFQRMLQGGVSWAVISGLILVLIAKHVGALGSLYDLLRRRPRN